MASLRAFGCILWSATLLFHGCSTGIYAPYPPPIPFANRERAVSVAAGGPFQVEYQRRMSDRMDLVMGASVLATQTSDTDHVLSAAGLLGVRSWVLPADQQVFNLGVTGGASFIQSENRGRRISMAGGELSVTPGFFFERVTCAFPVRFGGGIELAESAPYVHAGVGVQGVLHGERFGVGLRCEYVVGAGSGAGLTLIAFPVNLNLHTSLLF